MNELIDILAECPTQEIQTAFSRAWGKIHGYDNDTPYKNIMVSVSGGADSDVMLDMIERIGHPNGKVTYVFFDTGIEFKATKEHITELEKKYGITIRREKAVMPSVTACRKYGVPFLSKKISDSIYRLQKHDFKWEDEPFEVLLKRYPKCKSALRWWCNEWGEKSRSNINWRVGLKEFMIQNPPTFKISPLCCEKSKKNTAHKVEKEIHPDLQCVGVRKAEGGARASAYSSCFDDIPDGFSKFRPIFWLKDADKTAYERSFNIQHSACYTTYGLKRTGCACCPFGKYFEHELEAAEQYEPGLAKMAKNVFGESYEYTRKYKEFVRHMKNQQITIDDLEDEE